MLMFYLGLAIIGTIIPYVAFVPWFLQNDVVNLQFLIEAIANPISIFAWLHIIVAAAALLGFIVYDGQKNQVKWRFVAIAGTLSIGVSCGLPLYLYFREKAQRLGRTK